MYVMQISTHHPDACPAFNSDTNKATVELLQRRDPLLAKHGIKVAGSWNDLGAHTIYSIYDTPSLDEYWAFLNEPELGRWLTFNTVDNRVVLGPEDMQAMLTRG